jgi:hypothetical protein
VLKADLIADAVVDPHLTVSFGDNANFPSFATDFHLDWNFSAGHITGTRAPTIEFDNVQMDLGLFVSKFAHPPSSG